jgi:hypothetical protein
MSRKSFGTCRVSGYTRSNGTYVSGYTRSSPSQSGTISVRGYTKSNGTYVSGYTRSTPTPQSGKVHVSGYTKSNGTHVAGYTRSLPKSSSSTKSCKDIKVNGQTKKNDIHASEYTRSKSKFNKKIPTRYSNLLPGILNCSDFNDYTQLLMSALDHDIKTDQKDCKEEKDEFGEDDREFMKTQLNVIRKLSTLESGIKGRALANMDFEKLYIFSSLESDIDRSEFLMEIGKKSSDKEEKVCDLYKLLSNSTKYDVGKVSQDKMIITGIGTKFTKDMIGGVLFYKDGSIVFIKGYTSETSLIAVQSQTIKEQEYVLYFGS